jgi:hypothetical protein
MACHLNINAIPEKQVAVKKYGDDKNTKRLE